MQGAKACKCNVSSIPVKQIQAGGRAEVLFGRGLELVINFHASVAGPIVLSSRCDQRGAPSSDEGRGEMVPARWVVGKIGPNFVQSRALVHEPEWVYARSGAFQPTAGIYKDRENDRGYYWMVLEERGNDCGAIAGTVLRSPGKTRSCILKMSRKIVELFGGPDRDRTDDLFHAMEVPKWHFVDGKGLMSRLSRRNRPSGRSMLPICYQISNRAGSG